MEDPTILPLAARTAAPKLAATDDAWRDCVQKLDRTHETMRAQLESLARELAATRDELAQKSQLAELGNMTAELAQRLQSHLAPVCLYLESMRSRVETDPASLETIARIEAGAASLGAALDDLLYFARPRTPVDTWISPAAMLDEICKSFAPQLMAARIKVDTRVPPRMQVLADRDMLRRALTNLVSNAVDVMPRGGELVITAYEGSRGVEIEIADSGPGLPSTTQRVFEPFYTTKHHGTGLGLAIVQGVAQAHGGDVTVCNCPEGGAAFTIRLPRRALKAVA